MGAIQITWGGVWNLLSHLFGGCLKIFLAMLCGYILYAHWSVDWGMVLAVCAFWLAIEIFGTAALQYFSPDFS
jgi:hypothetical protein